MIKKLKGQAGERMPLRQPPLSNEVIAKIEKWIADGAKFKVAVFELNANSHGMRRALANALAIQAIERDGRIRWHQQLDPGALATPLVVGSAAFVAHSDAGLLVFASSDGELLARFFNGSGSSGQPTFDPVLRRVYASSDRGQLYALGLVE